MADEMTGTEVEVTVPETLPTNERTRIYIEDPTPENLQLVADALWLDMGARALHKEKVVRAHCAMLRRIALDGVTADSTLEAIFAAVRYRVVNIEEHHKRVFEEKKARERAERIAAERTAGSNPVRLS